MDELQEQVEALEVTTPRRSTRKRIFTDVSITPPAKRKSKPSILTEDKLKKFYMNKTSAKFARQALETIYEDPLNSKKGSGLLIGSVKSNRFLKMDSIFVTKAKKTCRKKKIKRLGMKGARLNKLSDEEFKRRLTLVDTYINQESCNVQKSQDNVAPGSSTTVNNKMEAEDT